MEDEIISMEENQDLELVDLLLGANSPKTMALNIKCKADRNIH